MNKPETSLSSMNHRKAALRRILDERDFEKLNQWVGIVRSPHRILTSFMFDSNPLICCRAVEVIGLTAVITARDNMESVRRLIDRFFLMMNDKSGNYCRYAPDAIGEIARNVPQLIADYGRFLALFIVEEPFEKGARLAIARIAEIDKSCFNSTLIKKLIQTLDDNNPDIRGSSIVALKALNISDAGSKISTLIEDNAQIDLYDFKSGELTQVTVGELAKNFSS